MKKVQDVLGSHLKSCQTFLISSCFTLLLPSVVSADLQPMADDELSLAVAQSTLPNIPLLDQVGFNLSASGIEVDLDIQADIGAIEWIDNDGIGENGSEGALMLKGVHIGGFDDDITIDMIRDDSPFAPTDLAMIRGMLVQADPEAGTLITINQLGSEPGKGIDIIVNDIYFGRDLSEGIALEDLQPQHRGWGLLMEDISNFASDDYVSEINSLFGLNLGTVDDGFNSLGGNYYPIQVSMQPLETAGTGSGAFSSAPSNSSADGQFLPGFNLESNMRIDAEFLIHMKKLAVYRQREDGSEWEMGIEGLMFYQGIDTTGDGFEDTIGPAQAGMTMRSAPHTLNSGEVVQAMHLEDVYLKTDIAMANIYIGNSQTGSLGAVHIDNLQLDANLIIYER